MCCSALAVRVEREADRGADRARRGVLRDADGRKLKPTSEQSSTGSLELAMARVSCSVRLGWLTGAGRGKGASALGERRGREQAAGVKAVQGEQQADLV